MSMTPVHPHLNLDRPLTREEMIEALRYEGMFGIGSADDIATARQLESEGLLELDFSDKLGWTICWAP